MNIHLYLFLAKIHQKLGNIAVLDLFVLYFKIVWDIVSYFPVIIIIYFS